MVLYLSLELLYVAGGYRTVLNDAISLFDQSLEILDFLFALLILHYSFLRERINVVFNIRL